mmetsp:Transcript_60394/g.168753  ORF Transcript_60394/g.168753 Transcript_60394/m.168753 type:complete len:227 (+) Transcript_60394:953-1633(+)
MGALRRAIVEALVWRTRVSSGWMQCFCAVIAASTNDILELGMLGAPSRACAPGAFLSGSFHFLVMLPFVLLGGHKSRAALSPLGLCVEHLASLLRRLAVYANRTGTLQFAADRLMLLDPVWSEIAPAIHAPHSAIVHHISIEIGRAHVPVLAGPFRSSGPAAICSFGALLAACTLGATLYVIWQLQLRDLDAAIWAIDDAGGASPLALLLVEGQRRREELFVAQWA